MRRSWFGFLFLFVAAASVFVLAHPAEAEWPQSIGTFTYADFYAVHRPEVVVIRSDIDVAPAKQEQSDCEEGDVDIEPTEPSVDIDMPSFSVHKLTHPVYYETWLDKRAQGIRAAMVGTGFIVHADAKGVLVLTQYHVVEKNIGVTVFLSEFEEYRAEVVAVDRVHDLAVLGFRADTVAHRFQVARLAPPYELRIGELLFSIGHPHGSAFAATAGLFSRWHSSVANPGPTLLLQLRLSTAGGQSGSPLYRLDGTVAGSIYATILGSDISFAVPIHYAKPLIDSAISAWSQ